MTSLISVFNFSLLEWFAIITTLLYNYLLTREKISCWFFGIVSSVASCFLFAEKGLWGQLVLYVFYAAMGAYGWWYWYTGTNHKRLVVKWPFSLQLRVLTGGFVLCAIIWFTACFMLPHLQLKTLDIFITIFSFIATYKESRKILSGWLYWIALNGFSIWLYVNADLKGMASLAAIYFFLSIAGYYNWRQSYVQEKLNANSSA